MAGMDEVPPPEISENFFDVDYLARFAIQDHNNKQNAFLKLEKIVNVREQPCAGTIYVITLEALDGGQRVVYEARVWTRPWENFKGVQSFRPVGDAPTT